MLGRRFDERRPFFWAAPMTKIDQTRKPTTSHIAIAPETIDAMFALLDRQTKECVTATLGIGWDTWIKIKRGGKIRPTTAQRLMHRLG